ncbi:hypothetical protein BKA07_000624 [Brevibacterium marinum]|uniref:Uncharacterized protein n=1 Tax=Brevibacterium marinum TaxID=418643 RepID=A0A846RPC0_9MICO|nr:hypothetical protein [Brevibacterium marinum]
MISHSRIDRDAVFEFQIVPCAGLEHELEKFPTPPMQSVAVTLLLLEFNE